jgi:enamine deaminase RidA (YjgF/YER057c/UK114 family)
VQVLDQLDATLAEAGSSREHLVSMTVLLKDIELGSRPWTSVWNAWVNPRHLPAMVMLETFLGTEDQLLGVSAVTVVPSQE